MIRGFWHLSAAVAIAGALLGPACAQVAARAPNPEEVWQASIVRHLTGNLRYPRGETAKGETIVEFTIDRRGHVLRSGVATSSGSAALDEVALAALRLDLPPPPPELTADTFAFRLPVRCVARRRGGSASP